MSSNRSAFNSSSKWYFRICCGVLFFVASSASCTGFYQRWPFFTPYTSPGAFESAVEVSMLSGTAPRPYVYRQLLPDIANRVAKATPPSIQDYLYRRIYPLDTTKEPIKFRALAQLPASFRQAWFFRYLIYYLLTFLSALVAVVAMFLVCDGFAFTTQVSVIAPVLVILIVPYAYVFPYDYSELAFLALAVNIALRFKWLWLLPLAALGAWNKGSFLFFIPTLYPFLRRRASRPKATAIIVTLTFLCGLVYLGMRARFAQNPGGTVIVQWKDHFSTLFNPFYLFTATDEVYGLRVPRISTILPTCFLVWSFVRVWKRLPVVVRQHGLFAIAINAPLYFLFCTPGEYRNLSLLSVLFLLTVAWNLQEWMDSRSSTAQSNIA